MLEGVAGPALLESYDAARRPLAKFTVEQAYTRIREPHRGLAQRPPTSSPLAHKLRRQASLHLSFAAGGSRDQANHSGTIGPRSSLAPDGVHGLSICSLKAQTAQQLSTLDLFAHAYVVCQAPESTHRASRRGGGRAAARG